MQFYSDFETEQPIFLYLSLTFSSHCPYKSLATDPPPLNLMVALGVFSTLGPTEHFRRAPCPSSTSRPVTGWAGGEVGKPPKPSTPPCTQLPQEL